MKIAFLCQSASCGHSYISKNFVDALDNHEVFIFATKGTKWNDTDFWKGDVTHSESSYFEINHKEFGEFLREKEIELLFINEHSDWALLEGARKLGIKVVTHVDWFSEKDIHNIITHNDAVLITAEHSYEVFFDAKNCHFVPWGINTEVFKPQEPEYDFFHSAGWGGINWRKCTPEIIRAFHKLGKGTMLLHTQIPFFDTPTKDRIQELRAQGRLKIKMGTVDHPGLYHKGRVYVGPSKLDGLGLCVPEALACGLPVITTNKLPMSQFVDEHNGWLIDTVSEKPRPDGYYFPEYQIDQNQLLQTMKDIMDNKYDIKKMGKNAREFIKENHDFETVFKPRVREIIENL